MLKETSSSRKIKLVPEDTKFLASFVGELNGNIKLLEENLSVKIFQNGNKISIKGEKNKLDHAEHIIKTLYASCCNGSDISKETIYLATNNNIFSDSKEMQIIKTPRKQIKPRTKNQDTFVKMIDLHELNFGIDPAGTGKTYLAVAKGVEFLQTGKVEKIVLIRPAVEAGEKLGFLPGDLSQKVDPYLKPLYDALFEMVGIEKVNRLLERDIIEVAPLAYLRGRTLNNSFIIMDEGQNTTIDQMKMFLTRMGFGSYGVVNGDATQIDLPKNVPSGLIHALKILKSVDGIGFTEFRSIDVIRHPLVKKIVDAYSIEKK